MRLFPLFLTKLQNIDLGENEDSVLQEEPQYRDI